MIQKAYRFVKLQSVLHVLLKCGGLAANFSFPLILNIDTRSKVDREPKAQLSCPQGYDMTAVSRKTKENPQ